MQPLPKIIHFSVDQYRAILQVSVQMLRAIANNRAKTRQDKFCVAAKTRLVELNLSITELAKRIGFARNTVSMAINHPIYPTVRRRIATALGISLS